jgi:hypothetical protein
MAAKELKERKRRREQEERPLPAEQMDADEAGFIRVGVNLCQHFEARRGGP